MMNRTFARYFDDMLGTAGFIRRSSARKALFPAACLLATGAAIGAGIGLVFAPSSGRHLREDVGGRFDQFRGRIKRVPKQVHDAANATS